MKVDDEDDADEHDDSDSDNNDVSGKKERRKATRNIQNYVKRLGTPSQSHTQTKFARQCTAHHHQGRDDAEFPRGFPRLPMAPQVPNESGGERERRKERVKREKKEGKRDREIKIERGRDR